MYRPGGVISSLVTSFREDGSLDEQGIRRNIEFQREHGISAIVVLGGTGEPMSMTAAERARHGGKRRGGGSLDERRRCRTRG